MPPTQNGSSDTVPTQSKTDYFTHSSSFLALPFDINRKWCHHYFCRKFYTTLNLGENKRHIPWSAKHRCLISLIIEQWMFSTVVICFMQFTIYGFLCTLEIMIVIIIYPFSSERIILQLICLKKTAYILTSIMKTVFNYYYHYHYLCFA